MPFAPRACLLSVLVIFLSLSPAFGKRPGGWERLQPGLWLQIFEPQAEAGHERLYISVLKIDPRQFDFHLLTASETEGENKTLPQWMETHDLQAAINASMFWKDQQTSTGYMKNYDHVNNSYLHPKYEGFLVFNPKQDGLPEIQIIDREHHPDWKTTLGQYSTVIQSFRMISLNGNNVWEQGSNRYSVASIGITKTGYVLFIFCQTPVTIHDLNNVLLDLPLELKNCLFVEGGPTAGLVVDIQEEYVQGWKGTSESFLWSDAPSSFARLPNVIGIRHQTEGRAETGPKTR
ncbi:phosphodiester glycosidase family protein [Desulfovermiculus halophilus]|uniref:phosphodiester glycosidase family protein n=1 Tax=Desulfovermiculus halophilus TaxID=339722 RepID=UPI000480E7ED|nr:phosphodiester glycosidase family protein [Desulfovermiculus halophilus]